MTKQELLSQKALYKAHVAFKEGELRSFKDKLKSIEIALQELEKGDQMDMFEVVPCVERKGRKTLAYKELYGSTRDKVSKKLDGDMNFKYKFKE